MSDVESDAVLADCVDTHGREYLGLDFTYINNRHHSHYSEKNHKNGKEMEKKLEVGLQILIKINFK